MISLGVFVAIGGLVSALTIATAPATPSIGIGKDWDLKLKACQDGSSFVLCNGGDGALEWNIPTSQVCLAVEPSSGSDLPVLEDGTIVTTSVDRTGLDPETHTGRIYVSGNDPQEIETLLMDVRRTHRLVVRPSTVGLSRPWRDMRSARSSPALTARVAPTRSLSARRQSARNYSNSWLDSGGDPNETIAVNTDSSACPR